MSHKMSSTMDYNLKNPGAKKDLGKLKKFHDEQFRKTGNKGLKNPLIGK